MNVAAFCVLTMTALGVGPRGYVLEFSGKTCPPCQQMAPIVSKLEREGLPIRKVDVEEERSLAEQYQVSSIPTFILIVDDREVERMSGAQAEGRIRQMLARVPGPVREAANDRLAVDLGDSAPLPRPEVTEPSEPRPPKKTYDISVAENPESPKRLWPFGKKPQPLAPSTVRGNNPLPMPGADVPATVSAAPMDASVRLRVMTGNKLVRGSGTMIESQAGRTTILTCSHISRGATNDTKVEVDLFRNGVPTTYVGTLLGSDPVADIGLITIHTDEAFPACRMASDSMILAIGAKVVSVGCGGGEAPSREQLRVTDINRYKGPDTLVCTGTPVQGRSGGGLFDESNNLVGVCFAATETGKSGVYCGLKPIYELLTKHDMGHLIPSSGEESALADSEEEAPASELPGEARLRDEAPLAKLLSSAPAMPASAPPSSTSSAEEFAADDAEVVVVIRSRSAGSAGDKVILIHKPSRKFLQFVEGEVSGDVAGTAPLTRQAPVVRFEAQTARTKPSTQSLQPTGLETQREPRPYVRSVR